MNISLFLTRYLLSLNLAIIIFVNFAVYIFILTSKLPVPSPLLSYILNLTTAIHCTIIFQSQIKRLQNIQNSFARALTRMRKSSHITPVLKSLHWLKINEHIKYKLLSLTYKVQFSQQTNLNTSTTWFLFNLVTTYVLHLWSLLLIHLPGPLWKSLINVLSMLHLVYGMNSPLIFASLFRHSLLHFHLSHIWQFIIIFFTIFTITPCIFSHWFSLSLWT